MMKAIFYCCKSFHPTLHSFIGLRINTNSAVNVLCSSQERPQILVSYTVFSSKIQNDPNQSNLGRVKEYALCDLGILFLV
jgi:hypothetical protein